MKPTTHRGGPSGGVYASLTGPGEATTPGELDQLGPFSIFDNDAGAEYLFSLNTSLGGLGSILIQAIFSTEAVVIAMTPTALEFDTGPGGSMKFHSPFIAIAPSGGDKVGFFAAAPVAQQPTPVTLADVIALLQAFGLSA